MATAENSENESLFRLNSLPYVARIHAIRLMQHREQIKLALSSKKMEQNIKEARLKTNLCAVDVVGKQAHIKLGHNLAILKRYPLKSHPETSMYIADKHLAPWLVESPKTDLEWTSTVYQRLQNILPCKSLELHINASDLQEITIKEILETPVFQNFEAVYLRGKELKTEDLDLVMETAHDDRDIYIMDRVPPNYTHENAFKFYDMYYEDARWVRLEQLYALKNCYQVRLRTNTFTCADINNLIKYWVNCEHDMFRMIKIIEHNKMEITEEKLAEGLIVIKFSDKYVVSAKNDKSRKFPILYISRFENQLILSALPIKDDNETKKGVVECYKTLHYFLWCLDKKKELEDELEAMDKTFPATEEERAELRRKTTEVRKKLSKRQEMSDSLFDFENGIAVLRF